MRDNRKLIPLKDIPYSARDAEARERRKYPSRNDAFQAVCWQLEIADGYHGEAYAPVVGFCLTRAAADALERFSSRRDSPWPWPLGVRRF